MDFNQPDVAIQVRPLTLQQNRFLAALRKIFASDPALTAQVFLVIPVIAAGIIFHISTLQWLLVVPVTLLALTCGIFRTAALLQIKRDDSLTSFHVSRIKCFGNVLVTISSFISLSTYLLIFIPAILKVL